MNTSYSKLILCALGACAALSANATGMAADNGRFTNGGTGFIGVTESKGQQSMAADARQARMPAGEATTLINGRPNANPEAPGMAMGSTQVQTQTMGNTGNTGAMGTMGARTGVRADSRNPSWGTPD